MLSQPTGTQISDGGLAARVGETLKIMHRWGYSPRIEVLSEQLLGGAASVEHLHHELQARPDLIVQDGFVCLQGDAHLIRKCHRRVDYNKSFRVSALAHA